MGLASFQQLRRCLLDHGVLHISVPTDVPWTLFSETALNASMAGFDPHRGGWLHRGHGYAELTLYVQPPTVKRSLRGRAAAAPPAEQQKQWKPPQLQAASDIFDSWAELDEQLRWDRANIWREQIRKAGFVKEPEDCFDDRPAAVVLYSTGDYAGALRTTIYSTLGLYTTVFLKQTVAQVQKSHPVRQKKASEKAEKKCPPVRLTDKPKGACEDCSCGRAELEEEFGAEAEKILKEKIIKGEWESACGSCNLGDEVLSLVEEKRKKRRQQSRACTFHHFHWSFDSTPEVIHCIPNTLAT